MSETKPVPLRKQQKDFTRQRLVDAARALFVKNGTRATSIDDIAKAAGTSRATFYAHFTDKQDVIRELARRMWETAFTLYQKFGSLPDWSHGSIGSWMREIFEAWERDADEVQLVVQEMAGELHSESYEDLKTRVTALMSPNPNWSRFEPEEAERRACVLIFQLERTMSAFHWGAWPTDREGLLKTLTDVWVATLKGED